MDSIPTRGYAMPQPTFRVRREFAGWDIDHTRFEIKKVLGKGSYGIVVEAFDHLTKKRVAIKKINTIFDVFENSKRIFREVRCLEGGRGGAAASGGGRGARRRAGSFLACIFCCAIIFRSPCAPRPCFPSLSPPRPHPPPSRTGPHSARAAAPVHCQAAARVLPWHQ